MLVKKKRNFSGYVSSPANALKHVRSSSSAVKPDDKNVYSGAVIKERVSQSKLSITQYP